LRLRPFAALFAARRPILRPAQWALEPKVAHRSLGTGKDERVAPYVPRQGDRLARRAVPLLQLLVLGSCATS
jgi:hypothetical protein